MTRHSERVSLRELLRTGEKTLEGGGIREAQADAWLLLEAACRTDRQRYLLHAEEPVDPVYLQQYHSFLQRRLRHEPVQYILGEAWLLGRRFFVTPDVLIPRLDTETLIEEALRRTENGSRILDLCTGSGCILLSLLSECQAEGCGTDLSQAALAVAEENRRRMGLQARWLCSDLFEKVTETYDMIVSNPPYIASGVIPQLDPEVRCHEPHMALDGGEDGLALLRRIIREAPEHLTCGGWLLLEIGFDQGAEVLSLLESEGYTETSVIQDMSGLDRVAAGRSRYV